MKKYWIIIVFLGLTQLGFGQEDRRENMRERIEAEKVAFITQQLDLSVEESQVFWPVYNNYQEKQKNLRGEMQPKKRRNEMTEDDAVRMIDNYFVMQEKELQLQKELYADLKGVIPPLKLVKLVHAEKQFKQRLLERIKQHKKNSRNKR